MVRPVSPYRGILPFRYTDRDLFFGREQVVEHVLAKVLLYRITILFGDSGAGKSSILNAGLIPGLEKENLLAQRLRVRPVAATPFLVERISTTPAGTAPFLPSIFDPPEGADRGETTIAVSLREFRTRAASEYARTPVLILDQFEELFTLFKGEEELQGQVLEAIFEILRDPNRQTKILLSIREDYFGKLEALAKRYPPAMDFRVRLLSLDPSEAERAILGAFDSEIDWPSRIDPSLASEIVAELAIGTGLVSATQLQIVCSRLWDAYASHNAVIGGEEYHALKGVEGILGQFFDAELEKLGPRRSLAIKALGNLVTGEGTRDVVSDAKLHELLKSTPSHRVDEVLENLDKQRLINRREQNGVRYNEVASEYLIAPLLKRVSEGKVEEERARSAQAEKELSDRQAEYENGIKKERRKRNITVSLVAGVLLAFLVAVYYSYSASAAHAQIESLNAKLSTANAAAGAAELQVDSQKKELLDRNAQILSQNQQIEQLKSTLKTYQRLDPGTYVFRLPDLANDRASITLDRGGSLITTTPASGAATKPGTSSENRSLRMFKSIDILIGLAVVMLMMSMVVTVITQFVSGIINLRGRQLLQGVAELIHQLDPRMDFAKATGIAREVLLHPLIRGTRTGLAPPYGAVIHREELTKILMGLASSEPGTDVPSGMADELKQLLKANGIPDPDVTLKSVRDLALKLEKANPGLAVDVRQNMALMGEAESDLVAKINSWFDQTIDRVSERFTGSVRVITFACAALVAGAIQLDTLALVNRLSMDDALRDSMVAEAQKITTQGAAPAQSGNGATPNAGSAATQAAVASQTQQKVTEQYREFLESRGLISIPKNGSAWRANWATVNPFGVLITVFLLSLGAPFWYNALKTLLNLRSTLADKDDAQRNQRQSSSSDGTAATTADSGQTAATTRATAAIAGERGDLNAVG